MTIFEYTEYIDAILRVDCRRVAPCSAFLNFISRKIICDFDCRFVGEIYAHIITVIFNEQKGLC